MLGTYVLSSQVSAICNMGVWNRQEKCPEIITSLKFLLLVPIQ